MLESLEIILIMLVLIFLPFVLIVLYHSMNILSHKKRFSFNLYSFKERGFVIPRPILIFSCILFILTLYLLNDNDGPLNIKIIALIFAGIIALIGFIMKVQPNSTEVIKPTRKPWEISSIRDTINPMLNIIMGYIIALGFPVFLILFIFLLIFVFERVNY